MLKNLWQRSLLYMALFLTLLASAAGSQANTLTASVDRDTLSIEETFTLTLRYSGQSRSTPDLTAVQRDFEVLNTQQSNQTRIINGRVQSLTEWRIALAPKKSGQFTLPAITLDDATSQPITLTVEAQSSSPRESSQAVFVELETDKDTAWVQEQIIVTIRLFTAVPLNNIELQPLELANAVVTSLDEKQYQTNLNGRPHAVVESRFAIFPQTSGELVIPSLFYNVTTGSGQRDIWGQMYGNRHSNLLRLRTTEQRLTIKTIPDSFAGKPWLPASNVTLGEHWSAAPEHLKIGEPVTRTITLTADGLTAGQIAPIIQLPVEGLTFYPDQAQTSDQTISQGIQGTRTETLAIVPTRGGTFTLPAVEVEWWDTVNNVARKATLPETRISVEHNVALQSSSTGGSLEEDTLEFIPHPPGKESAAGRSGWRTAPVWLLVWALVTSFTTLLFAALWWRSRGGKHKSGNVSVGGSSAAVEKGNWIDLKRASSGGDLQALKKAVLAWARHHWQRDDLHSLAAVAAQTDRPELQQQLRQLDEALYSPALKESWDSGLLLQQIYACQKERPQPTSSDHALKPLYHTSR